MRVHKSAQFTQNVIISSFTNDTYMSHISTSQSCSWSCLQRTMLTLPDLPCFLYILANLCYNIGYPEQCRNCGFTMFPIVSPWSWLQPCLQETVHILSPIELVHTPWSWYNFACQDWCFPAGFILTLNPVCTPWSCSQSCLQGPLLPMPGFLCMRREGYCYGGDLGISL